MRGKFTSGTSTGVEARVNLKLGGAALTSASSSVIPTIQAASGPGPLNTNAASQFVTLIEPSVGYVTFGAQASGNAGLTKLNGSSFLASGNTYSFPVVRVPINGWTNSNVIIGTFNEVQTVPGVSKPKQCRYFFGGASATLAAPTECTTGTCIEVYDTCGTGSPPSRTASGIYENVTWASGTWAVDSAIHCNCVGWDTTTATDRACGTYFVTGDDTWKTNSSGGYVSNFTTSSHSGTASDTYMSITCEGVAP
jgi:hypothetical protein